MLLLALSTALAGDPCPIDLRFAEYTPSWRDRAEDLAALQSRRTWMGLTYGKRGGLVRVKAVIPNSPAAAAGLEVGERIAKVNDVVIRDTEDANAAFDAPAAARQVTLSIDKDGEYRNVTVARGPADPVFLGLVNAAENQSCREVRIVPLSEAQQAALAASAFDDKRAFQCDSAHKALAESFESGSVVMIRGGSRILLTMPGWSTQCVGVDSLDGSNLSLDALTSRMESLSQSYVQDRHDNP